MNTYRIYKFAAVGILNNLVNFLITLFSNKIFNLNPFISAAIGFLSGAIISYALNSKYTFNSKTKRKNIFILFLFSQIFIMVIHGYFFSLALFLIDIFVISWLLSTFFTFFLNYFLQKKFVFRN